MQTTKEMTPHCTEAEAQDNHIWRSRHQHQIQAGQELGDKFERTLRSNDNDELPTRSSSCVYEYENRLLVWYIFLIIIVTPTTTKRHNDTRIAILLLQSEEDGFRFSRDEGRSRTGGRTLWRCLWRRGVSKCFRPPFLLSATAPPSLSGQRGTTYHTRSYALPYDIFVIFNSCGRHWRCGPKNTELD